MNFSREQKTLRETCAIWFGVSLCSCGTAAGHPTEYWPRSRPRSISTDSGINFRSILDQTRIFVKHFVSLRLILPGTLRNIKTKFKSRLAELRDVFVVLELPMVRQMLKRKKELVSLCVREGESAPWRETRDEARALVTCISIIQPPECKIIDEYLLRGRFRTSMEEEMPGSRLYQKILRRSPMPKRKTQLRICSVEQRETMSGVRLVATD